MSIIEEMQVVAAVRGMRNISTWESLGGWQLYRAPVCDKSVTVRSSYWFHVINEVVVVVGVVETDTRTKTTTRRRRRRMLLFQLLMLLLLLLLLGCSYLLQLLLLLGCSYLLLLLLLLLLLGCSYLLLLLLLHAASGGFEARRSETPAASLAEWWVQLCVGGANDISLSLYVYHLTHMVLVS